MQISYLSDDQLLYAIAENTDAMSALVQLDAKTDSHAKARRFSGRTVDRNDREYRDLIAEIRRRYP